MLHIKKQTKKHSKNILKKIRGKVKDMDMLSTHLPT